MDRSLGSPLSSVSTQPSFDPTLRAWWDAHAGSFHGIRGSDDEVRGAGGNVTANGRRHADRRRKQRRVIWMTCSAMVLTSVGIAVAFVVGRTVADTMFNGPTKPDEGLNTKVPPLPTTTAAAAPPSHQRISPSNNATRPPRKSPRNGPPNVTTTTSLSIPQGPEVDVPGPQSPAAETSKNNSDEGGGDDDDGGEGGGNNMDRIILTDDEGEGVCKSVEQATAGDFNATKFVRYIDFIRDTVGLKRVEWSVAETSAVQFWVTTSNASCLASAPTESPSRNILLVDETAQANSTFYYPVKNWYLAGTSAWNYTTHACIDDDEDSVDCRRFVYLLAATSVGCDVSCGCQGEDPHVRRLWCSFDVPVDTNLTSLPARRPQPPKKPTQPPSLGDLGRDDTIRYPKIA